MLYDSCFPRRFYAVTSRRLDMPSYCSNSISRSAKLKHQQHQQQFVRNDKPTSQFTTQMLQHPDNGDVTARQYFVLEPEQQ